MALVLLGWSSHAQACTELANSMHRVAALPRTHGDGHLELNTLCWPPTFSLNCHAALRSRCWHSVVIILHGGRAG
eukprot:3724136-Amphidinium_carterae.1